MKEECNVQNSGAVRGLGGWRCWDFIRRERASDERQRATRSVMTVKGQGEKTGVKCYKPQLD